jgi:hypothetical protein
MCLCRAIVGATVEFVLSETVGRQMSIVPFGLAVQGFGCGAPTGKDAPPAETSDQGDEGQDERWNHHHNADLQE